MPPAPPSRPSIAVLPFENLTQDAGEDYFSAGVAEDLITELSKISGLFVAARPSSFAMRQTPQDAMATCARLKVSYVLDGSVRRAGDRVRITARLVDGATGGQVWAERYDRTLTDLFAVQDEIARSIVGALEVKLLRAEREALARPPTGNLEAYNLYLRGLALFGQRVRPSYELARRMFCRAAELDPDFARALAGDRRVRLRPVHALRRAGRVRRRPGDGGAGGGAGADASPARMPPAAWRCWRPAGRTRPLRSFEQAIAVDPGHAGAHYAYRPRLRRAGPAASRRHGCSGARPTWHPRTSAI